MEYPFLSRIPENDSAPLNTKEHNERIARVLSGLPQTNQDVMRLLFAGQRSQKEIAAQLQISEEEVRRIIQESSESIRIALGGGYPSTPE